MEIESRDGELYVDDEISESGKENKDSEEEREGKRKMGEPENKEKWYNRDKPPQDDCCPICFDDFHFPCRTSCGHWFCSSCILQLWRYSKNPLNPCKCPRCFCLINNLVLESSVLIQPGEEVGEILQNIQQYNRLRSDEWSVRFLRAVRLTLLIIKTVHGGFSPMMNTLVSMIYISDCYGLHT